MKSKKPGPEVPKKATTPAAKKPAPKPTPKPEYESYTDFFKGNNKYKKGTKAVEVKKKK